MLKVVLQKWGFNPRKGISEPTSSEILEKRWELQTLSSMKQAILEKLRELEEAMDCGFSSRNPTFLVEAVRAFGPELRGLSPNGDNTLDLIFGTEEFYASPVAIRFDPAHWLTAKERTHTITFIEHVEQ